MGKKVRGSAFYFGRCHDAEGSSADDFYRWLEGHSGQIGWPYPEDEEDDDDDAPTRRLFFQQNERDVCGAIVTASRDRHEHYEETRNGRTVIVQREIDGEPPVQINLFAWRKDTRNGVYAHYRGSYGFRGFLKDLWGAYRAFVSGVNAGRAKNDRVSVWGMNETAPLFSREEFRRQVEAAGRVTEVNFRAPTTLLPNDAPEPPDVRGSTHCIRLVPVVADNQLIRWLLWLREQSIIRNRPHGSVIMRRDRAASFVRIDFDKTMNDYLGFEYDRIGDVDTGRIFGHEVIVECVERIHRDQLFNLAIR